MINKNVLKIALLIISLSLIATFFTALVESRAENPIGTWDLENTLWWWLATISSVGYGDIVPVTALGKIFASVVIISSFFILGLVIVELNLFVKKWTDRKSLGFVNVTFIDHIVIVGHNALVEPIINYLQKDVPDKKIVWITDRKEKNSFKDVHFIHGDPKSLETLQRASIQDASIAIIMADELVNNPDAYSIVVAEQIEKINKGIYTIAELRDSSLKAFFDKVSIDYFISEKTLMKGVFDETQIKKFIEKSLKNS